MPQFICRAFLVAIAGAARVRSAGEVFRCLSSVLASLVAVTLEIGRLWTLMPFAFAWSRSHLLSSCSPLSRDLDLYFFVIELASWPIAFDAFGFGFEAAACIGFSEVCALGECGFGIAPKRRFLSSLWSRDICRQ